MKTFFVSLLAFCLVSFSSLSSAAPVSAAPARLAYSTSNLTTTGYRTMFSSLIKSIQGISVYNTGANPIFVAVGPSGQEQVQMMIAPQTAGTPAVYYPLGISQGNRISVVASTGTISSGDLIMNVLYYLK